ncbi:MAG: hypothetical protein RSD19_02235, partial [Oscillospiraceae bacterium]
MKQALVLTQMRLLAPLKQGLHSATSQKLRRCQSKPRAIAADAERVDIKLSRQRLFDRGIG